MNRRASRFELLRDKDIYRFDAQVTGETSSDPAVAQYLASANIVISDLDPTRPLRARVAQFTSTTFVHVVMPKARVSWPRDLLSLDRALVLICMAGRIDIECDGPYAQRYSGQGTAWYFPPDLSEVKLTLVDDVNELIYMSVPAGAVADVAVSGGHDQASVLTAETVSPLLAFVARLCALPQDASDEVMLLRAPAEEVARTLARLIASPPSAPTRLYDRAIRILGVDYADTSLDTDVLASRLKVSRRTLQLAFQAEGRTVASTLRQVRVDAARRVIQKYPSFSMLPLARSVGFGSAASLRRALNDL